MKQNAQHFFTDHARLRLAERSILTEEEFLALADASAVLVYRADAHNHYEMIWSSKDRNGYVMVFDPLSRSIITIKRVLTRGGFPCQIRDARRKPNFGHAKITSSMLERAILAAGADISEGQDILDVLKAHEKADTIPRAWHYRWVLRFLRCGHDGRITTKTKTLGRETEIRAIPPDAMIAEAEAVVKAEGGWDAVFFLVERSSSNNVVEWPLANASAA